ncbi:hypothetical protein EK904_006413 [Melospiza melodia maxima]|nr:hypothetical protein EK904_006413 [Melospiza melodia maxima]
MLTQKRLMKHLMDKSINAFKSNSPKHTSKVAFDPVGALGKDMVEGRAQVDLSQTGLWLEKQTGSRHKLLEGKVPQQEEDKTHSQHRGPKQAQKAHMASYPLQIPHLDDLLSGDLGDCRHKGRRKVYPREQYGYRAASLTRRDHSPEGSWIGRKEAEEVVQEGKKNRWGCPVKARGENGMKKGFQLHCNVDKTFLLQQKTNSQNATAETAPLSSPTAELHRRELGDQNDCNIQTLLHHHTSLDLTEILSFVLLKPHSKEKEINALLENSKGWGKKQKKMKKKKKRKKTRWSQTLQIQISQEGWNQLEDTPREPSANTHDGLEKTHTLNQRETSHLILFLFQTFPLGSELLGDADEGA